jgi:hypothetical protein
MTQRTPPHPEILPPDDPEHLAELAQVADLLDEVLRFGTNALNWAAVSAPATQSVIAPIMMHRHILGLLGGLSVQIRSGWIESSDVTLRAMLEAFLNLEFLVQDKQEERGFAFLAAARRERIAFLKKLDPSTTEGQAYQERHQKDGLVGKSFKFPRDVSVERKELSPSLRRRTSPRRSRICRNNRCDETQVAEVVFAPQSDNYQL